MQTEWALKHKWILGTNEEWLKNDLKISDE